MGWISATGKGLRMAGEIVESAEFQDWLLSKGEAYLQKKMTEAGISIFRSKETKAKRAILKELNTEINNNALKAAIDGYEGEYLKHFYSICYSLDSNEHIANRITYIVPRFCINKLADLDLRKRLWNSAVIKDLFSDEVLKDLFFRALVHDMDETLSTREISSTKPFSVGGLWLVTGIDLTANWEHEIFKGHYFVFHDYQESRLRADKERIQKQISETNRKFVELTDEQRTTIIQAWNELCAKISEGERSPETEVVKYLSTR